MAAVAFDPLEYARALESSGISREQAEVHAKAMTQVFVHNMDALVTKDYLDTRFSEFEARLEAWLDAKMEKRFTQMDARFDQIDSRFTQIDSRFTQIDARFAEMDVRFARTNVMLAVILAAVAIPLLQNLFTLAA